MTNLTFPSPTRAHRDQHCFPHSLEGLTIAKPFAKLKIFSSLLLTCTKQHAG